jgi:hypothetical protein
MTHWLVRRCHQLYALTRGYFWLPCPVCGEKFGGHEANLALKTSLYRNQLVCPRPACKDVAIEERRRRLKDPQWGPRIRIPLLEDKTSSEYFQ